MGRHQLDKFVFSQVVSVRKRTLKAKKQVG